MKVCGNCQVDVEDGLSACPRCGAEVPKGFFASLLGGIFGGRKAPASDTPNRFSPPPTSATPAAAAPSVPAGSSTGPFAFEVEDVFSITGRGTVATGRVTRGSIAVGDEIAFVSAKGERVTRRVTGIEAFRKIVEVAKEGETVGILLGKPVGFDVLVRGVIFERA